MDNVVTASDLLKSQRQLITVLGKLHRGSTATYSVQVLPISNPNGHQYNCRPPETSAASEQEGGAIGNTKQPASCRVRKPSSAGACR